MRSIKTIVDPGDWKAYTETQHQQTLLRFAEDESSEAPMILFPDLAPDKGLPNGTIFATNGVVYPYSVGQDLGCGYTYGIINRVDINAELPVIVEKVLRGTSNPEDNILREIFFNDLVIESPYTATLHDQPSKGEVSTKIREYLYTAAVQQTGMIRRGNHFIEIDSIQLFADYEKGFRYEPNESLFIVVHNGSDVIGDILAGLVDVTFGAKSVKERNILSSYQLESRHGLLFVGIRSIAINYARYRRMLIIKKVAEIVRAELSLMGDNNHTDIFPSGGKVNHYCGVSQVEDPGKFMFVGGSVGCKSRLVVTKNEVKNICGISHGTGADFYDSKNNDRVVGGVLSNLSSHEFISISSRHRPVDLAVGVMESAGLVKTVAELSPLVVIKNR
ncbi:MAG: RtcB family protein [Anaerolineaceae bacterium]|nr:RtcB family protein [Anaerolineaceae bacterium]MBN2676914.1 RtcB family protein [Anaerolineaceae bacterium]